MRPGYWKNFIQREDEDDLDPEEIEARLEKDRERREMEMDRADFLAHAKKEEDQE